MWLLRRVTRNAGHAAPPAQGLHATTPRYVGAEEVEEDGEPFAEKYPRLLAELEACFGEGERLTGVLRERLGGVDAAK